MEVGEGERMEEERDTAVDYTASSLLSRQAALGKESTVPYLPMK